MSRTTRRCLALCLLVALPAGCERVQKSDNPLSPSLAGPIAGVAITAPKLMEPVSGSQISVEAQPVVLTVGNSSSNGVRPVSYVFQIATDSAFSQVLFTQTGVAPGDGGKTSYRMPQNLAAERKYYWRSKADDGANASDFSAVADFTVFTPVLIQPPVLLDPADNATIATKNPTLAVANSSRTGPAGAISYIFEVGTDPNMVNRVVQASVAEGNSSTSYTTPDLAASTRFYWRVRATDPGHVSGVSSVRSFVTPAPIVIAPTPSPSPIPGGGGGSPAANDQINMGQATILNSPLDIANWPVTTAINGLTIRSSGVSIDFSKKDGPGRWPDITPPGWSGPLQYTLGMCLNISGRWYCSAVVEYWYGLAESGGPPSEYAMNWFYDPARWSPMTGHQPAVGEMIGFFVCAGDCRNNTKGDLSPARERSNVVLVPMPTNAGASYRF